MAMAVTLARHGFRVALVDAAPVADRAALDFDGRAYAVAPGSRNLLASIGLWDEISAAAQPIARIEVEDRLDGPLPPSHLHFDPAEAGRAELGWIVEDHVLRRALLSAVEMTEGLDHIAPDRAAEVVRDGYGATVELTSGRSLASALIVACDGRRSAIARDAGIRYLNWSYDQVGLVAAISHSADHQGLARQGFYPGGPFAVLPMTGRRSALVWSERPEEAERIASLEDAAYLAAVATRIGGRLGEIELAGKRWSYPLGLALAQSYTAPRLVVAGDAAHGVHPIAGQGMNLGLRDAAALTETLVGARRLGLDLGDPEALRGYEQWRRFDATALSLGMDALNRLFSNNNPPLQALRNLGLQAVSQVPPLRASFIGAASGVAETAPALLAGRAI